MSIYFLDEKFWQKNAREKVFLTLLTFWIVNIYLTSKDRKSLDRIIKRLNSGLFSFTALWFWPSVPSSAYISYSVKPCFDSHFQRISPRGMGIIFLHRWSWNDFQNICVTCLCKSCRGHDFFPIFIKFDKKYNKSIPLFYTQDKTLWG